MTVAREPDFDTVVISLALLDEMQCAQLSERSVDHLVSHEAIAVWLDFLSVGHGEIEFAGFLRFQKQELIHHADPVLRATGQRRGLFAAVEAHAQHPCVPIEYRGYAFGRVITALGGEFLRPQPGVGYRAAAGKFFLAPEQCRDAGWVDLTDDAVAIPRFLEDFL